MLKRLNQSNNLKRQKSQMSLQKSPVSQQLQFSNNNNEELKQIVHSTRTLKVHQLLKNSFIEADKKLLYNMTLPTTLPLPRAKHLVMKNVTYILSNWLSDQFPNVIYIGVDGINGYISSLNTSTPRVGALQLDNVEVSQNGDLRTYQLKYKLNDATTWKIPVELNDLKFRVYIDNSDEAEDLPLPNPLTLSFEVRLQR